MTLRVLALAALAALAGAACRGEVATPAPVGMVRGTARAEGKPMVDLTVRLDDRATATDGNGEFAFADVTVGPHVLEASQPSADLIVEDATRTVTVTDAGSVVTVSLLGRWVRESVVRVIFDPPFAPLPVQLIGADTLLGLDAQEPREDHCWAWSFCLPKVGQATFSRLRSGTYQVRMGAVDRTHLYVLRDRDVVRVGRGDTATVTLVVAPASGVLTIRDTVAGTPNAVPAGYGILLGAGEMVDLRMTVEQPSFAAMYERHYITKVFGSDGREVPPALRLPWQTYWQLIGSDSGPYIVTVEVTGDFRGEPPKWFGIAMRAPAGPGPWLTR